MAERPNDREATDQPEPEEAIPERPLTTPDHPVADSDDRQVELDEPDQPDPPVDDADRDPAKRSAPGMSERG